MASEDGRVEEIMSLVMGYRATVRALPPPPMSSVPRQLLDAEIKAEEAVLAAVQALAAERDAMAQDAIESRQRMERLRVCLRRMWASTDGDDAKADWMRRFMCDLMPSDLEDGPALAAPSPAGDKHDG